MYPVLYNTGGGLERCQGMILQQTLIGGPSDRFGLPISESGHGGRQHLKGLPGRTGILASVMTTSQGGRECDEA